MPDLLDKRLVVVTGKGGVGKSTVSFALGLAAAARGKRNVYVPWKWRPIMFVIRAIPSFLFQLMKKLNS